METPLTIKRLSKHQRNPLSVKPTRLLKIKVSMKVCQQHVSLVESREISQEVKILCSERLSWAVSLWCKRAGVSNMLWSSTLSEPVWLRKKKSGSLIFETPWGESIIYSGLMTASHTCMSLSSRWKTCQVWGVASEFLYIFNWTFLKSNIPVLEHRYRRCWRRRL